MNICDISHVWARRLRVGPVRHASRPLSDNRQQHRIRTYLQNASAKVRAAETEMLHYAVVFFIIAIVAAILGFGGIAAGAAGIAKVLFFVFLVLAVLTFLRRA